MGSIERGAGGVNRASFLGCGGLYTRVMFTGLVQCVGRVVSLEPSEAGRRLVIDPLGWGREPGHGESICISGVCLTMVGDFAGELVFDVAPETLGVTTLGSLAAGSRVNIERSLAVGDLIGGHFVQGHVDGRGVVERVESGEEYRLRIGAPAGVAGYLVPKGSICVDGVSLTIAGIEGDSFEVMLIPTTLEETTLGGLAAGDGVNLEADSIAKAVAVILERRGVVG